MELLHNYIYYKYCKSALANASSVVNFSKGNTYLNLSFYINKK